MSAANSRGFFFILVLAALGLAAWWYWPAAVEPEPAAVPAEPADPEPEAPRHPLPPAPPADDRGELVELPALDDSDAWFQLALLDLFGTDLEAMLVNEALIEKFVTTIDNLPRQRVAEKVRPLRNVAGTFMADSDGSERFVLNPDNYARYAALVDMLAGTDPDAVVATYRRYYPLLQEAYVRLGYPDGYFNDRVVEVIDHLLAAPDVDGPLILVRPKVLYEYADPELEALSAGQKLMLRIGSGNAAQIKAWLAELRTRIA